MTCRPHFEHLFQTFFVSTGTTYSGRVTRMCSGSTVTDALISLLSACCPEQKTKISKRYCAKCGLHVTVDYPIFYFYYISGSCSVTRTHSYDIFNVLCLCNRGECECNIQTIGTTSLWWRGGTCADEGKYGSTNFLQTSL